MRTYLESRASRALTPTGGFLRGFAFTLNPYVGCAFGDAGGCPFCYVRALAVAHAEAGPWGSWVIAKSNLADLLVQELEALERTGKLADTTIFMSSATDPYQGLERRLRLSRAALKSFVRFAPRRLLIQTRSPMIERDIGLLRKLGRVVIASISVETDNDAVRRALTPTSPSIARRLDTARRLRAAGIFTQLAIAPMMPNNPAHFAELAADVADRVVIDTYFDGDGAHGRRSRALGIGDLYGRLGFESWFVEGAEKELLAAMRAGLGAERVLFSRAGFNCI